MLPTVEVSMNNLSLSTGMVDKLNDGHAIVNGARRDHWIVSLFGVLFGAKVLL